MKPNINVKKCLFQVKYKPVLTFYDKLYKKGAIFDKFPHWQTDRLKIALKDYDQKQSLTIQHDSITYETDKFSVKNEKDIVDLINDNLNDITAPENISRLGHRYFCLVPLEITFHELVEILNLKLFSREFSDLLDNRITDSTVTITAEYDDLIYRLQIGPMKDKEVSKFIAFNVENHIDASSTSKYTELADLVENYPKTSLFIDLDLWSENNNKYSNVVEFYSNTKAAFHAITNNLIKKILEDKLK